VEGYRRGWLGVGYIDMKDLTEEQQRELEILAIEMEAEAIQMKIDYEQNPTPLEESGSIIVVHENADILNEDKTNAEKLAEWNPDPLDLPDIDEEE